MRGGRREGAGRKSGVPNKPKLQLVAQDGELLAAAPHSPKSKMAAMRRHVAWMVATGMSGDEIAAAMGLTCDKLKAVFARELEHGYAIARAELVARFLAAGDAGKVNADKKLEELTAAMRSGLGGAAPTMGKKAAAAAGARDAVARGGIFAPPRPPAGVGKKEWANHRAADAAVGTSWEELSGDAKDGAPN